MVDTPERGMEVPEFVEILLKGLLDHGFKGYIVGGAVRDFFLKRPMTDWDIATDAPPESIQLLFKDIRQFSLQHGTVTLVNKGQHYEVSTFRGAGCFGRAINEDLAHRDFTINAMAYDRDTTSIFDPYKGREDLKARFIRAVENPQERFKEDPLRLLRAVRFATELGFHIEPKTREAMASFSHGLSKVSPERIREELLKILKCSKPSGGFYLLIRTDLLRQFLPELLEGRLKRQNHHHRYTVLRHVMETIDAVDADPVLRLTALFHDIAKPRVRERREGRWRFIGHEKEGARMARNIMKRLRFSNKMIETVTHLIEHHMIGYDSTWSNAAVRRLVRRVGWENMGLLLRFRKADVLAHGEGKRDVQPLRELEKRIEMLSHPPMVMKTRNLAINGHKIMEVLNLKRGPEVGHVLNELLEVVTDHPEWNTEAGLMALLRNKGERAR